MTQLTNEMIIQSLNKSSPFMRLELIGLVLIILLYGIVYFFKLKKEQTSRKKKDIIIFVFLLVFLIGIPVFKGYLKYNAIQYSIENNCFEVVTDTVARKKFNTNNKGNSTYYVFLTNNGKITVGSNTYYDCSDGESVYVVIAKSKFGKKYLTGQLYPTNSYEYVNE